MAKRKKIPRKKSKKLFTKTASKTKAVNHSPRPMRGGIRM